VIQGARFKHFVFDILVINPETKRMKVVEVIFGHDGLAEKRAFCEKNGIELEVIRPARSSLAANAFQEKASLYNALGDAQRLMILAALKSGPMRYSELEHASGLNPAKDSGKFSYRLKLLVQASLVDHKEGAYKLTSLGASFA
jgi:hypothetical protein